MNVGFWGEGKTGVPGEKPLGAGKRTNKLSPHETLDLRIEPGSHWWEASALTTTPSLLPTGKLILEICQGKPRLQNLFVVNLSRCGL